MKSSGIGLTLRCAPLSCFMNSLTLIPRKLVQARIFPSGELSVIFLNPEYLAPVVARECRGIENDVVKAAVLLSKATEPVEGVSFAKVVICGVDAVEEKVLAGPVEVNL